MAYTRTAIIDATPSGDSVKQAVLDLDADLTGAYDGLNQLQAALALKINQSEYDQPSGTPRLDASGKLKASQLPGTASDLPVGMIAPFGMESLPANANWLECNGAELLIADYQALYGVIGNAFGLAQNPSNFKLPDLRGQFLRGWDHGRGKDPDASLRNGGDHVGSAQPSAVLDHIHPMYAQTPTGASGGGNAISFSATAYAGNTQYTAGLLSTAEGGQYMPSGIGSGFHLNQVSVMETRPTNVAVLYCIKWR
jgi:microcystin-dependent protein